MKPREHDPRRLDVERFASDAGRLDGLWPLPGMPRLLDACHPEALPADADRVAWRAAGERRRHGVGESHAWLHLSLQTRMRLTCQRCLGPVETPLVIDRWFHFVAGEQQAAQLDADVEEDVLASTRSLDLHELAQDELLLALPLVPRHDACPQPLLLAIDEALPGAEAAPNAFAALAAIKRRAH